MKKALGIILLSILLSIGFVFADTNGIWHKAADVRFGTFGDDEGGGDYSFPNKLGIGTDSPSEKLDVEGNILFLGNITQRGKVKPSSWGGGLTTFDIYSDGGSIGVGSSGSLKAYMNKDGKGYFAGNVGIGTTSPTQKLDVNGNLKVRGSSLYIGNDVELRDAGTNYLYTPDRFDSGSQIRAPIFYDRDNAGYYANPSGTSVFNSIRANIFYDQGNTAYYANPASTSRFNALRAHTICDESGGNCKDVSTGWGGSDADTLDGISSERFLRSDVDDTANGDLTLSSGVGKSFLALTGFTYYPRLSAKNHRSDGFATGLMGQASDGRGVVGVTNSGKGVYGTSEGNSARGVEGRAAGDNSLGVYGRAYGTGSYGVYGYSRYSVGIYGHSGTSSSYDFYAGGSGVNYGSPSSIRWKEDIVPIKNVLSKLDDIDAYEYDWNEEHGGLHDIGFIGEEVGEHFPEIVVWDENETGYVTGMDYSKMTPVLLAAIKEQQNQIDILTKSLCEIKPDSQACDIN